MSQYNQTRSFNLGIAQETSVEAALIYDSFSYLSERHGGGWFYHTYEQLLKFLPIASERTMRNAINQLEAEGWIEKKTARVNGKPVAHYHLLKSLSAKSADSVSAKSADSLVSAKSAETYNRITTIKTTIKNKQKNPEFLSELIAIINPNEKNTTDRLTKLNARLQDYEPAEIRAAAHELAKSEWHRDNKQMSIDNLLAPSKFGRWYQAAKDTHPKKDIIF